MYQFINAFSLIYLPLSQSFQSAEKRDRLQVSRLMLAAGKYLWSSHIKSHIKIRSGDSELRAKAVWFHP